MKKTLIIILILFILIGCKKEEQNKYLKFDSSNITSVKINKDYNIDSSIFKTYQCNKINTEDLDSFINELKNLEFEEKSLNTTSKYQYCIQIKYKDKDSDIMFINNKDFFIDNNSYTLKKGSIDFFNDFEFTEEYRFNNINAKKIVIQKCINNGLKEEAIMENNVDLFLNNFYNTTFKKCENSLFKINNTTHIIYLDEIKIYTDLEYILYNDNVYKINENMNYLLSFEFDSKDNNLDISLANTISIVKYENSKAVRTVNLTNSTKIKDINDCINEFVIIPFLGYEDFSSTDFYELHNGEDIYRFNDKGIITYNQESYCLIDINYEIFEKYQTSDSGGSGWLPWI